MTDKKFKRANGVIMPIFSICSKYGIGTFGKEAYELIDFFEQANIHYWQILPLGPTSYGDSPYQSFSSFAGNAYFIDLDFLKDDNLLEIEDYENVDFGDNETYIDYAKMYNNRFRVLEKAYENSKGRFEEEIASFREEKSYWLEDYALYMAIKEEYLDVAWAEFPEGLRDRNKEELEKFYREHEDRINFYIFIQFEFFRQWKWLKDYANSKNIEIIGDIPIYLALDSVDSWVNSNILKLDDNKNPKKIAGVPPDDYSKDGQLWGNPVYDWEILEKEDFYFWKKRIGLNLELFDIIRLDHFRGFESYYEIDTKESDARYGSWQKAKPYEFFKAIKETFPNAKFIAEDLGFISQEVIDLREYLDFPGMNVIQFAFSDDFSSIYLPHNYKRNSVVYSSTHDSDTLKGWIDGLEEDELEKLKAYFDKEDKEKLLDRIIRGLMASVSDLSIFEIQDFLGLNNLARINCPGSLGENWKWRTKKEYFTKDLAQKIKDMSRIYGR